MRVGQYRSSSNGTTRLPQLISDEGSDIDGEDARTTLGNGNQVEHLVFRHPLLPVNHLFLNQRNHGISTTEGEYANLKESLKRFPVEIHQSQSF